MEALFGGCEEEPRLLCLGCGWGHFFAGIKAIMIIVTINPMIIPSNMISKLQFCDQLEYKYRHGPLKDLPSAPADHTYTYRTYTRFRRFQE